MLGLLGLAHALAGETQLAQTTLRRLEQAPPGNGGQPAIARVSIALGDVDGGLAALQRALELHDPFFNSEPLTLPVFNKVRNDPRFTAIVRKLGLLPQGTAPTSSPIRLLRVFRQT